MARVLALVPDLLFGSQVQGTLSASGHEVALIGGEAALRERLEVDGLGGVSVLVVDLNGLDGTDAGTIEELAAVGRRARIATLGFYSHVDAATGERARAAGFDLVVARSRMAREGSALVERVAAGP